MSIFKNSQKLIWEFSDPIDKLHTEAGHIVKVEFGQRPMIFVGKRIASLYNRYLRSRNGYTAYHAFARLTIECKNRVVVAYIDYTGSVNIRDELMFEKQSNAEKSIHLEVTFPETLEFFPILERICESIQPYHLFKYNCKHFIEQFAERLLGPDHTNVKLLRLLHKTRWKKFKDVFTYHCNSDGGN